MSIIGEVFSELFAMFFTDARLSFATLFLVAIVAGLMALRVEPVIGGGVLLVSCLVILVTAAHREARGRIPR